MDVDLGSRVFLCCSKASRSSPNLHNGVAADDMLWTPPLLRRPGPAFPGEAWPFPLTVTLDALNDVRLRIRSSRNRPGLPGLTPSGVLTHVLVAHLRPAWPALNRPLLALPNLVKVIEDFPASEISCHVSWGRVPAARGGSSRPHSSAPERAGRCSESVIL